MTKAQRRARRVVDKGIRERAKDLYSWLNRMGVELDGDKKPYVTSGGLDAIENWMSSEAARGEERGKRRRRA